MAIMDSNPFAEDPARQSLRDIQIDKAKKGDLRAVMRDDMKPHYLADTPNRQQVLDLCMAMALDLGEMFLFSNRALWPAVLISRMFFSQS